MPKKLFLKMIGLNLLLGAIGVGITIVFLFGGVDVATNADGRPVSATVTLGGSKLPVAFSGSSMTTETMLIPIHVRYIP
jgi:hypothetical protein